jgi:hypothetical protein
MKRHRKKLHNHLYTPEELQSQGRRSRVISHERDGSDERLVELSRQAVEANRGMGMRGIGDERYEIRVLRYEDRFGGREIGEGSDVTYSGSPSHGESFHQRETDPSQSTLGMTSFDGEDDHGKEGGERGRTETPPGQPRRSTRGHQ